MKSRLFSDRAVLTLSLCAVLFVLAVLAMWLVPTLTDAITGLSNLTEGVSS